MVSVTVNQPPIQTSETHTPKLSMTQYRGGGVGRYCGRAEKASDEQGLAAHSKCLCVIIHPQREALPLPLSIFFLLWGHSKPG